VEFLDLVYDAEKNLPLENLPLEICDTILKSLYIRRQQSFDLAEDAKENLPLENLPLEIRDTIFESLNIGRLWSSWTW
jgi:hypothetical protein